MTAYIALVRKVPETAYGIDFPDFPGCISGGDTLDECLASGREALQVHVQFMLDEGMDVPAPQPLDAVLADPESHDALAVLIDLPPVKGKAATEVLDVDQVHVAGARRTTGAHPGRQPRPVRISRAPAPEAGDGNA
jgi:predicted RNase H-like HicB family nuclease